MGTVIDRLEVTRAGWRSRHSALQLAVTAARRCLQESGQAADDVDLLINAGIYRDRNLAEPALAALIQQDIGAHPEDPHPDTHGTFSFDVANGTCGVLTAMQIADGFLRSRAIRRALIVASDADPGHRMTKDFPFSPAGTAMLCTWRDGDAGLGAIHWVNRFEDADAYSATVGLTGGRNVVRFDLAADLDVRLADAAADAVHGCLHEGSLSLGDVDAVVAAPAGQAYRDALAERLDITPERITVADDARMHTGALIAALARAAAGRVLMVAAGGGITAGAAIYRGEQPATGDVVGQRSQMVSTSTNAATANTR